MNWLKWLTTASQWQAEPPAGFWFTYRVKFSLALLVGAAVYVAGFASLLMSTIAVGSAVAPAQVSAAPVEVITYA